MSLDIGIPWGHPHQRQRVVSWEYDSALDNREQAASTSLLSDDQPLEPLQPRLPKWASEMNTVRNWLRFTGGSLGEGPEIVHIEIDLCSDHVWAVQSVHVP